MLKNLDLNKLEKGQSLVEVLVVLVVAAIMIIALTVVILSSLKNAQYAQNQTKATKYAQDAMDKIKMMKDVNTKTLKDTADTLLCFNKLWDGSSIVCTNNPPKNECYFRIENSMLIQKGTSDLSKENLGEEFNRYIIMNGQNASPGEITLTAKVTWADSSGTHESKVQTILIRPSYDCQTDL